MDNRKRVRLMQNGGMAKRQLQMRAEEQQAIQWAERQTRDV